MLKELKEDMEKVKRRMDEQSGNIKREPKKKPKEILELKSTIIEIKKFSKGIQRQIWADRQRNQWTWR